MFFSCFSSKVWLYLLQMVPRWPAVWPWPSRPYRSGSLPWAGRIHGWWVPDPSLLFHLRGHTRKKRMSEYNRDEIGLNRGIKLVLCSVMLLDGFYFWLFVCFFVFIGNCLINLPWNKCQTAQDFLWSILAVEYKIINCWEDEL